MIVKKAMGMANMMQIPVLGIAENMSYFTCPDCGKRYELFGKSKADDLARAYHVPTTARIPIDPALSELMSGGRIEEADTDCLASLYAEILRSREISSRQD